MVIKMDERENGENGRAALQQTLPDNDFKYILQDTGMLYLGARFSYEELLTQEMVPFKLKTVIERYLLTEVDPATTLESHFYYMTQESFSCRTFRELRVKVRASFRTEKKSRAGETRVICKERLYPLKEFVSLNLAGKKQQGIVIREIVFPKISLMGFTV